MTAQIIQGDCLDVLRTLESESVQTCVTSPPYYGLRSYQTEPQVWDGNEFCDHEWVKAPPRPAMPLCDLEAGRETGIQVPWQIQKGVQDNPALTQDTGRAAGG